MTALLNRLKSEPALLIGFLASALVLIAQHFNILLTEDSLTAVLTPIVTGILVRPAVTPNAKVKGAVSIKIPIDGAEVAAAVAQATTVIRDAKGDTSLVIDPATPYQATADEIEAAKRELDLP